MKLNLKKMILIALYTAMMTVLSLYGTFSLYGVKITIQNLPLMLAAITLGAIPGALVGFIGMLLNQMLTYGFTATTLFWVLPQTIIGMFVGFIFEKKLIKQEASLKFFACIIISQIVLTLLNTISMYVDAVIFGYYNFMVVFGTFILRIMLSIITGIAYCVILPLFIKLVKKIH